MREKIKIGVAGGVLVLIAVVSASAKLPFFKGELAVEKIGGRQLAASVIVSDRPLEYDFAAIKKSNELRAKKADSTSYTRQPAPPKNAFEKAKTVALPQADKKSPPKFRPLQAEGTPPNIKPVFDELAPPAAESTEYAPAAKAPYSCETQNKFEYTGPDRPGLLYGMCIDCSTTEFISNNGRCLKHK